MRCFPHRLNGGFCSWKFIWKFTLIPVFSECCNSCLDFKISQSYFSNSPGGSENMNMVARPEFKFNAFTKYIFITFKKSPLHCDWLKRHATQSEYDRSIGVSGEMCQKYGNGSLCKLEDGHRDHIQLKFSGHIAKA